MRVRWRWSLTIETGRSRSAGRQTTAADERPTLEATDGGQFETDGQDDAGEMMATRLPAFDSTERHGPDTFGRFR